MSAILVKKETCHLHQLTEKTFLICHRRIVPRQMEIHFWCMTTVLEMERKFLFSHYRTHCSFWQIQNIGMLMVHSGWVCPEIFFQLYTIHGQCDGGIFPCVFSLLSNKIENSYNRLFEQLLQLVNNLGNYPNDALAYFERSAINAF